MQSTQSSEYGHLLENKVRFVFHYSSCSLLLQSQSWTHSIIPVEYHGPLSSLVSFLFLASFPTPTVLMILSAQETHLLDFCCMQYLFFVCLFPKSLLFQLGHFTVYANKTILYTVKDSLLTCWCEKCLNL